jgi:FlaG protein
MSVTRIEGARPVEPAQQHNTALKPRVPEDPKPREESKRASTIETPDPPPSNFKPYALSFRFEKELNRVVVKVIDPATGELLREIPPEAVIEALKQLRRAPGALVDEEV